MKCADHQCLSIPSPGREPIHTKLSSPTDLFSAISTDQSQVWIYDAHCSNLCTLSEKVFQEPHPEILSVPFRLLCPRCGSSIHLNCEKNPPWCLNYKGPHSPSSVHSPFFALRKEILEQCAINKFDSREVPLRVRELLSYLPLSYIKVTTPSFRVASHVGHPFSVLGSFVPNDFSTRWS